MFCPQCGRELPDNASFCSKCGAVIDSQKKEETSSQSNPNEQQDSQAQTAAVFTEAPATENPANTLAPNKSTLTCGMWLLFLFVLGIINCVPFIGFVLQIVILIVLACMDKKTFKFPEIIPFARATLILMAIVTAIFIIVFLFVIILTAIGVSMHQ